VIIPGKHGHVYEHSANELGVYLAFRSVRKYNFAAKMLRSYGCLQRQDAEMEGTFLFVPTSGTIRQVLKVAGIKKRRVLSEAQKRSLEKARQSSPLTGKHQHRAPMAFRGVNERRSQKQAAGQG